MDSVCHALEAILGESGKRVIFYHMENEYSIDIDEIVRKPKEFADALEEIFGVGARVIEENIIRNVYKDLELDYKEDKEFDFTQSLREAIAQGKNR